MIILRNYIIIIYNILIANFFFPSHNHFVRCGIVEMYNYREITCFVFERHFQQTSQFKNRCFSMESHIERTFFSAKLVVTLVKTK